MIDIVEWRLKDAGYNVVKLVGSMSLKQRGSVLNKFNQIHAVKNVFVTDGACMTSAANQNPSLTYMALTARAVNHAVKELKRMNF